MNSELNKNYLITKIYDSHSSTRIYKAINNQTSITYCLKVIKSKTSKIYTKENEVLKIEGHLNIRSYRLVSEITRIMKSGIRYYYVYVSPFSNYTLRDLILTKNDVYYKNYRKGIDDFNEIFQLKEKEQKQIFLTIFKDIVRGVAYLHKSNVIHRDLKPENIFINSGDLIPKIGDFDCVKKDANIGDIEMTQNVGTTLYAAPELTTGSYTCKLDIFPLGIIFYEILVPFNTQMERITHILSITKNSYMRNIISEDELKILKRCLEHDADIRISAKELFLVLFDLIKE